MTRAGSPPSPAKNAPTFDEKVLVEKYAPLLRRIANDLSAMKPAFLERDDVLQDGMIGLLRAIRTNRPVAGQEEAQFTAYVRANIRGAIIDGYRAAGNLSRAEYAEARRTRLDAEAGSDIAPHQLNRAEALLAQAWTPPVPIDAPHVPEGALIDPAPGPEQRTIANQLLRLAVDALQQMAVRDRSIFIACELAGEKQTAVARRYGLTHGRISQIIKSVRQQVLLAIA